MKIRVSTKLPMQRSINSLVVTALVLFTLPVFASSCENLATAHFSDTTITKAEVITGGTFTSDSGEAITGLPPFCRVAAVIKPTSDSDIRVEVWMPESGWNGRIDGTGNGGLAGKISYGALANGLRIGYAVANTDMGMATPPGADASVFVKQPERWIDWGYRATHVMTVLTKQVVSSYYARDARKAYFTGCSTGGEQALMEAQRFPDDYDGIVGGAAANNRTGVHVSILWNFSVPQKTPDSYLPPAKVAMLSKAVVNSCDLLDGVKDRLIADPQTCNFDPEVLKCKKDDQDDCLTRSQVETVRALYSGPVNPRTRQSLYPGLSKGSEVGWDGFIQRSSLKSTAPYAPIFEWVFSLDWNWRHFDFDHDVDALSHGLASAVNATSGDIDTFRAHGHKLLMYHGWSDPLVTPGEAINYYNAVVTRDKSRRAENRRETSSVGDLHDSVDSSYRLFMVPGMEHCGGGPGPSNFDALAAMVRWVEQGIAPDAIIATKVQPVEGGGTTKIQRLLCPYPRTARYNGIGSINDATSYKCMKPGSVSLKDTLR